MATSYTGLRVQDTYNAIIKIGDNSNLSATPKLLSDGVGNDTPLYLSGTRLGIGITPAYQFHTSGNAKIGGNLIISGNLTVNGTLTYLNVEDLAVEDPLIKLAKDNTSNTLDIGFFGKYVESATTKYTGLFWDASTDKFRLYEGLQVEPTTTVDVTGTGYTRSLLNADLEGNVTGTVSSLSNHDTNDLVEGSFNQYFTTTRARASFTAGTGVTITNGEIAIGQDVGTTSNVTFGNITGSAISGTTGTFNDNLDVTKSTTGNLLSRVYNSNTSGTGTSSIRIANGGNQANGARLEFSDSTYYNSAITADRTNGLRFFVHDDATNMNLLLAENVLTLANDKSATFTGNVDIDGNLQVDGTIKDSSGDAGTSGQLLSSTATGTNWIDFDAEVAKRIEITVKNVSGSALVKGAAVHASPTATPPSGNVIEVIGADNDVTASMPAIGILNEAIADEAEGKCVMVGSVTGINTSSFTAGEELYVGSTAGVLTNTKPTSTSNQIQKIAVVIKSHASNGQIEVFGAGRANDVPNLVDRTITFDPSINITATSGFGRIEIGGPSGGFIDLKAPASDDYDLRIIHGSNGSEITSATALKLNSSNALAVTFDGNQDASFAGKVIAANLMQSTFPRVDNPNSINTNLYLIDSTDMAADVGGSIVFSGKYNTSGTLLSGGPFIRAYKENADNSNYSFGLKFGIRLNGSAGNDTALTIKPNKDVVVSEGDLKVDSSTGDSVIILDNSNQLLRIDQNSIRTTTNSVITFLTNSLNALQLDTSQNSKFYGDLYIPENLIHTDDTDTYIKFRDNRQTLGAGGTEFIDFANTTQDYITIGGGSDIDIKLVSSTNDKYIFIQGSDGNIGINDLTPSYAFDVNAETNFTTGVRTNGTRYHQGGSSTYWYASTTNARINWDARVEGTGVMIHKWNRNADDNAYLSYAENWYDGNSYHKISAYNDGFMLNGNIRFESYGAGNITGTLSRLVGFEANGGLIDVPLSSFIDGSGVAGRIPYFTDSSSLTSSSLFYESSNKIRHLQTIGASDNVRDGFCLEDQSSMAANVGGQLTFRYMYLANGGMTEGALIRMYKLNATDGDYSSGLKFQVRNTGDNLSTKMTLNPSGFLGLATTTPQKVLHLEGASGSQALISINTDSIGDTAGLLLRAEGGESDSSLRAKGGIFFERTALFGKGKLHLAVNGSANNDSATIANARLTIDDNGLVGIAKTSGMTSLLNFAANQNAADAGADNWSGSAINTFGGDIATGRLFLQGYQQTGNDTIGINVESTSNRAVLYNYTDSRYLQIWNDGGNIEMPSGALGIGVSPDSGNGGLQVTKTNGIFANANQKRVASFYDSSVNSEKPGIILGYDDSSTPHGIIAARTQSGTSTIPGIQFFTYNGSSWASKMVIEALGDVAIGQTSSSGYKFQVRDDSTWNVSAFMSNSTTGSGITLRSINTGVQWSAIAQGASGGAAANNLGFHLTNVGTSGESAGYKMVLTASGQLSLLSGGTLRTGYPLNITANSSAHAIGIRGRSSDNISEINFANNADTGLFARIDARTTRLGLLAYNSANIEFHTSGTFRAMFDVNGYLLLNRGSNATNQPLQVEGFIDITKVDESALRIYNGSTFRGGFGMSTWGVGASVALTASDMVCYAVGNLDFVTNGTSSASVRVTNTGNLILTGGVHAFNGNYGGIAINVPSATKKYVGFYDSGTTNYGGGMWYDEASNITSLYSLLAGTETQHVQLDRGTGETWINPSGGDVAIGHNSPLAQLDIAPASGDADLLLRTASQTLRFDQNSIRTTTSSNLSIFVNNNTANGFYLNSNGIVMCGTTTQPECCVPTPKFYVAGTSVTISVIGSGDNVRSGLAHYDSTTGNGAGVGGQLVLGYRYSGTTYTEGAIIKMYKTNSTVGNYSSGLKFQVRNNGEGLSAKMTLNAGGDLSVVGSMTAAGDVIAFSDKRVKTNIKTINNGLEKISKLRGVSYNRTDIDDKSNKIGVIAQEVKEVLPEVVIYNEDDDKYGVEYGKMAGVFIEAIKELKAEVDSLKQEIKELKK